MSRKKSVVDASEVDRLWLAWIAFKDSNPGISQTWAARELGINQSAFSQYLNGAIPLNLDALVKFCLLFSVDPFHISPRLYGSVIALERQLQAKPTNRRF